jgi:hypothetical protein
VPTSRRHRHHCTKWHKYGRFYESLFTCYRGSRVSDSHKPIFP